MLCRLHATFIGLAFHPLFVAAAANYFVQFLYIDFDEIRLYFHRRSGGDGYEPNFQLNKLSFDLIFFRTNQKVYRNYK